MERRTIVLTVQRFKHARHAFIPQSIYTRTAQISTLHTLFRHSIADMHISLCLCILLRETTS